jgi:Na+-driven multidrug efflux pump
MTFQSIGKSWTASFLATARQGFFFLPLILVLPRLFGLRGVQISQAFSDLCTFLFCIPFAIVFLRSLRRQEGALAEIPDSEGRGGKTGSQDFHDVQD